MRFVVLACLLLLAGAAVADEQITAGDLEPDCKLAADGEPAGAVCMMVVDGFVYGYMFGAERGVRVANASNQAKLESSDPSHISDIHGSARCLPEEGSTRQVVQVFTAFLESHPERRTDRYALVLNDAIESRYCTGR